MKIVSSGVVEFTTRGQTFLFHLIELPPHRRVTAFHARGRMDPIELPLPWVYHIASVQENVHNPGFYMYRIMASYCSPQQIDPFGTGDLYCLPLPNCGIRGYICSPSARVTSDERDTMWIRAVDRFWTDYFAYNEHDGNAHASLYRWAGLSTPPGRAIRISPYQKWEKLTIEQVLEMPWIAQDGEHFTPEGGWLQVVFRNHTAYFQYGPSMLHVAPGAHWSVDAVDANGARFPLPADHARVW